MKHSQQGLTLVELMIALLLGLLLSFAAIQLLVSNQRTFSLQDAVTGVNEDGQTVLRYIAADIRNAGRGGQIEGFVQPVVLALSVDDSEGNPVAFQSTDGGANGNDVLVVSYLAQRACQGADLTAGGANPEGEIVVNRYFVVDDSLWCASVRQLAHVAGVAAGALVHQHLRSRALAAVPITAHLVRQLHPVNHHAHVPLWERSGRVGLTKHTECLGQR